MPRAVHLEVRVQRDAAGDAEEEMLAVRHDALDGAAGEIDGGDARHAEVGAGERLAGERWKGPEWQVRALLETTPWIAVGFRLAVVDLLHTAREHEVLGQLGPDPLSPAWDAGEALRRLTADPDRVIGDALLDQRVMAGPGNIWKSEICFLRGVDPWTPVGRMSRPERLVALVKELFEANRTTGDQITTGDLRPGRGQWVYGRGGRPCRRCGTLIRVRGAREPERVTYWCPACQSV